MNKISVNMLGIHSNVHMKNGAEPADWHSLCLGIGPELESYQTHAVPGE